MPLFTRRSLAHRSRTQDYENAPSAQPSSQNRLSTVRIPQRNAPEGQTRERGDGHLLRRTTSDETLTTLVNTINDTEFLHNGADVRNQDEYAHLVQRLVRSNSSPPPNDTESIFATRSIASIETVTDKYFNEPATHFTAKRQLPIASGFMKNGVLIFPLETSLQIHRFCKQNLNNSRFLANLIDGMRNQGLGLPILQTHSPILGGVFKKNAPFMVIYRFLPPVGTDHFNPNTPPSLNTCSTEKYEYVKVYYKHLNNRVSGYALHFIPDPQFPDQGFEVIMLNNTVKACTDCYVKGTKLRFLGTTSSNSTFGSSSIKMLVVDDEVPILNDYYSEKKDKEKRKFEIAKGCPLLNNYLLNPLRNFFNGLQGNHRQPFRVFGKWDDSSDSSYAKHQASMGSVVLNKVAKHGDISFFENPNPPHDKDEAFRQQLEERLISLTKTASWPTMMTFEDTIFSVSQNENSLILTCLLLVLQDQEKRKYQASRRLLYSGTEQHGGGRRAPIAMADALF
ncbi:hypothetical protein BABINDRAFT_164155 [Babjeviella inositovora NRRL Y-12698]|uniref:Uncharacterized protein n=1 Tax=Babjeviella inositovora NRRL Y-12698 TaxID=984486 RepID=A0A1E3QXE9_9ASCO|nr:uncharacterized protein BABINDRAFT_164155 [Babjeviella inositovora NRRL Y-12698]ODQ82348.1 hypothetical protein BABINDRAFT_164155 [Babjeviella inositovora NRRL Y-12698]